MTGPSNQTISVIIPVWNEARLLRPLVERLRAIDDLTADKASNDNFPRPVEIIVSDCGSDDGTVESVESEAITVTSPRGRAVQMNRGAAEATGDILWFLHVDCFPLENALDLIRTTMNDPDTVAGGFRWDLTGGRWYYPLATGLAHSKNRLRKNLFGDMGIFVRRKVFEELGGYREIPVFEEVELNSRLRKKGKIVLLDEKLPSSDRKLVAEGPVKAFVKNDILKILYSLGVSPGRLARMYRARADSDTSAAGCGNDTTGKMEE